MLGTQHRSTTRIDHSLFILSRLVVKCVPKNLESIDFVARQISFFGRSDEERTLTKNREL